MKVLVSAYACNPYQGSEPGVGWAAVKRISENHDVYLLTDSHNREGLKKAKKEGLIPPNLKIRILRKNTKYSRNRLIARIQSWLWYVSYNRLVLNKAIEWHQDVNFDLCHQVTIAAWRVPSPLWQLPIPFIWGPIGGAGHIPHKFRCILSPTARIFEFVRDIQTFMAKRSKRLSLCIRESSCIFAANEETKNLLAPFRGNRPLIWLPIVSISDEKLALFRRPEDAKPSGPILRLFAGGNIGGSKGVSLALQALAIAASNGVEFHYTIAGGGPEISSLKRLCYRLGLEKKVEFHPGYQGEKYIKALHRSDVYFLPSFRESTPVTLIEAYLAGCYPVVADIGAQGEIVGIAGGHKIAARSAASLIEGLAETVVWCSENRDILQAKANNARARISDRFSSSNYERTLEDAYSMAVGMTQHSKDRLKS